MPDSVLLRGPGICRDHQSRQVVLRHDETAYLSEDGRVVVRRDRPHAILSTEWKPRKKGDAPAITVVGIQEYNDGTLDVVVSAADPADPLLDEWGERAVNARAITLDQLIEVWAPAAEADADEAIERVTDALRALDRLG